MIALKEKSLIIASLFFFPAIAFASPIGPGGIFFIPMFFVSLVLIVNLGALSMNRLQDVKSILKFVSIPFTILLSLYLLIIATSPYSSFFSKAGMVVFALLVYYAGLSFGIFSLRDTLTKKRLYVYLVGVFFPIYLIYFLEIINAQ